ncbi:unnamed protein product [Blepharisma stoltei]|uniref:Ferredoxin n=1 Tax=Blepharisma stoltei TaxID=1481888 RepID=A0AAU9IW39_9CILI|nr:unnamed protein product [Blepharisma stoltei]
MPKIRFFIQVGSGMIETMAREGSILATVLRREGITKADFSNCNYQLECGTCTVNLPEDLKGVPLPNEEQLLMQKGKDMNVRCSCQVRVSEEFKDRVIKYI